MFFVRYVAQSSGNTSRGRQYAWLLGSIIYRSTSIVLPDTSTIYYANKRSTRRPIHLVDQTNNRGGFFILYDYESTPGTHEE